MGGRCCRPLKPRRGAPSNACAGVAPERFLGERLMRPLISRWLPALALGLAPALAAGAAPPVAAPPERLNKKLDNLAFSGAGGRAVALADLRGKEATVVVFLSFDCPVSNGYAPVLAGLAKSYA